MKKIIFTVIPVLLGVMACLYAAILFQSDNPDFMGKYSPQGRDSNAILLVAIIGIGLLLYGLFNWLINKPISNKNK